jgi:NTE family protein
MSTDGIVLALGGGGARGLAHVGVLQVLEREGVPVTALAGTSIGGLFAALFAAGVPLARIEEELLRLADPMELLGLVDLALSSAGVSIRGVKLYDLLTEMLGGELEFAQLRCPLALVTADLGSGREVVLTTGPVAAAARATVSLPILFQPVEHAGLLLVDGGLLDNLPIGVARSLARDPVVAVDVLPRFSANQPGTEPTAAPLAGEHLPKIVQQATHVAIMAISEMTELRQLTSPADLVLRPEVPSEVSLLVGFHRAAEIIAAGREAAEIALPRLRRLAGQW